MRWISILIVKDIIIIIIIIIISLQQTNIFLIFT